MSKQPVNEHGALRFIRAQAERIDTVVALGEIVDNSIDAGARRIDIAIGDDVVVHDDGCGCAAWTDIITLFGSVGESDGRSGRFGYGLKVAAICLGPSLRVESSTGKRRALVHTTWDGRVDHVVEPVRGPSGTTITVREANKWNVRKIAAAAKDLAKIYRPALVAGRSIIVNKKRIKPWPLPALDHDESAVLGFEDGRSAEVVAGILRPGAGNPGIDVFYENVRWVERMSAPSGTGGFYAAVTLRDRPGARRDPASVYASAPGLWGLGVNKTDVDAAQTTMLLARIQERFAALIERALLEPFKLEGMPVTPWKPSKDDGLIGVVPGSKEAGGAPPPDGPGGGSGGGRGRGGGGHEQDQNSKRRRRSKNDAADVHACPFPDTPWLLGVAHGKGVTINLSHDLMADMWKRRMTKSAPRDAFAIVIAFLQQMKPSKAQVSFNSAEMEAMHRAVGEQLRKFAKSKKKRGK